MPAPSEIHEQAVCRAPARAVWKLLHDPVRFADWWTGWERVEPGDAGAVTRFDSRWPDFAYPTSVTRDPAGHRVVISCLLSDIVHEWSLEPHGGGCLVGVTVTVPESEAPRAAQVGSDCRQALAALVACAEAGGRGP